MAVQTYATHRHNPVQTGIGLAFLLLAIIALALWGFGVAGGLTLGLGLAALIAVDFVLLSISRAYTTRLQDRIIRLEMTIRAARLLSAPQQATLSRLSTPQIVALRFASDAELASLVERAETEHLAADQIKRAIKDWLPDQLRT